MKSDRAYATLLEEIQSGVLVPGAPLAEAELAARLGVSRTPLREAIGRLVADGLAVQQSPRITVVSDFDAARVQQLFEVRRALEEAAARLASTRGDAETFARLADEFAAASTNLENGHSPAATADYYALIARFDTAIDAAVANDYLTASLRTVRTHLVRARRLARHDRARLRASAVEHGLIANAIAAGDADLAAHATHIHLHNALQGTLASLSAHPEGTP
ncbi:MAG TPA: GntR family transcriptional regulator [Candidatus Lumbricidophila sp.]|nr:GntR family transcriptional regulator [Candidatus Lumbricidophila sp.]